MPEETLVGGDPDARALDLPVGGVLVVEPVETTGSVAMFGMSSTVLGKVGLTVDTARTRTASSMPFRRAWSALVSSCGSPTRAGRS